MATLSATGDSSAFIAEKAARSADLETTIRVLKKDLAEIDQETKAAQAKYAAARASGDAAAATAAKQEIDSLNKEWGETKTKINAAEAEKSDIDANIARLQARQQELAAADKVPVPVTDANNTTNTTNPTSTITEGNRNAPLPVTDPGVGRTIGGANIDSPAPAVVTDPTVGRTIGGANIDSPAPAKIDPRSSPGTPPPPTVDKVENTVPVTVSNVTDPQQRALAAKAAADAAPNQSDAETARLANKNTNAGLTGKKENTQSQATQQDAVNFQAKPDWRVRLSLSPGAQTAKYLYWADPPGILAPLQATDGVIFPYTPAISVAYNASYDPTELTHSNYKFYTYRGSAVDSVSIGCDFTAQDTSEAQYLLAVIHFFRSITKMFYGQDQNPKNGTPPPLCYLSGLGAFQFDAHPLAITSFTYTLPTDVDYIKAGSTATPPGVNKGNSPADPKSSGAVQAAAARMGPSGLNTGAVVAPPNFQTTNTGSKEATYVPTKISISIQAVPIVTRNDISNKFSLKEYATGALLRGTKRAGGGIW